MKYRLDKYITYNIYTHIWCAMDPIKKYTLYVSIPAPWIRHGINLMRDAAPISRGRFGGAEAHLPARLRDPHDCSASLIVIDVVMT